MARSAEKKLINREIDIINYLLIQKKKYSPATIDSPLKSVCGTIVMLQQ
jgi:hypothetical protein